MPRLTYDIDTGEVGEEKYVLLKPGGFIDSSNAQAFEKAIDAAADRDTRFAVFDMSGVHYINSSGISNVIRAFGIFRDRKGLLVLTSVPRPVGLSMHLLGVTSLIPFQKDTDGAVDSFRSFLDGRYESPAEAAGVQEQAAGTVATATRTGKRVYVPVRKRKSPLREAKVLVLVPRPSRFSRILKLRFRHLNGNFNVVHDADEALSAVERLNPDLVVVDHRMDSDGDFVGKLKLQPERSLISLIKIYSKDTDVDHDFDFKIWENDYLVDPFEILELFSLSEAELLRVPKDRKVFQQQVRFEFRTSKKNLEKANRLCEVVIRGTLDNEEDRTAMYAAVKEGLDNAVLHGNQWKDDRMIDVNFLVDRKKLTCIVEDEGAGFDFEYYLSRLDDLETFERAKKRIMDEGGRGGLGILLMHRCTDRIDYAGAGNVLRLEKNLS